MNLITPENILYHDPLNNKSGGDCMKGSIHQTKYGWQVRFDKITRRFKRHEHTEQPHRGFTPAERFLNGLQYETDRGTYDIRDYRQSQPIGFGNLVNKFLLSKRKKPQAQKKYAEIPII